MRLTRIILLLIIVLSIVLRFWKLSEVPPSLSWDEVAFGYNAWSILETGRDEYGTRFPMLFRSFDEYKLPGLVYLTVISEAIFGLNEIGVRFPSAFFGVLIVIVGYFLVREIKGENIALLASFMLAINPWLINFSRQSFEANISLFFVILGTFFLIKTRKKAEYVYFVLISFVISTYFYYSSRLIVPLILLIFFIKNSNFLHKNKKIIGYAVAFALILSIPLFSTFLHSRGYSRISQVVVTKDPTYNYNQEVYSRLILDNNNALWARLVFNRRFALFETIVTNYLKNLSPEFIFVNGVGATGLLYMWELPFLLLGVVYLFRQNYRWRYVLLVWFFASPLAGALTKDQPNALRTLIGAPIFVILSSFGIYIGWTYIRKFKKRNIYILGLILTICLFFTRFLFLYFSYYPKAKAIDFGDGYKQLANFLESEERIYDEIWVTGDYWRPYIHLLFHLKYNPSLYQKKGTRFGFDKYRFGKADWDSDGVDLAEISLLKLTKKKKLKVLFIFSDKEYNSQKRKLAKKQKFSRVEQINGRYAEKVFWAVEL
jgi:4-amino-4-deoxy-L-arabinose transferase-like glycosyltransferase